MRSELAPPNPLTVFRSVFSKSVPAVSAGKPVPGGGRPRRPDLNSHLLDFDLGARFFELLLGGIGVGLVRAFQHGLRRAFHQGLGFGEA